MKIRKTRLKPPKPRPPLVEEDPRDAFLTGSCNFCGGFPKAAIRTLSTKKSASVVRYCESCLKDLAEDMSSLVEKLKGKS